jgi:hypothetical protein
VNVDDLHLNMNDFEDLDDVEDLTKLKSPNSRSPG